jgi:uncharacterized beta-barrel protein YwiB (DUF1934 family)
LTKDVLVSIQGLQFASSSVQEEASDEELDKIETICPGEYFYRNSAHFVLYEEILDDMNEPVKNMIKVRNSEFVLTKKGPLNVQMVFSEGKKTMTDYVTPFGNIMIALDTKKIDIQEKENTINIHISYGLEANYQFIADCDISMEIRSRA